MLPDAVRIRAKETQMRTAVNSDREVPVSLEMLEDRLLLSSVSVLLPAAVSASSSKTAVFAASPTRPTKPTKPTKDDYGNTFETAKQLSLSADGALTATGKIETVGDVDMFTFTATVTGTMTVTMTGSSTRKTTLVPLQTVYDQAEQIVPETTTSSATFEVTVGERYYVEAAALNSSTGSWSVTVSTVAPEPDVNPPAFLPTAGAYEAAETVTPTAVGSVLVVQGTTGGDVITISQTVAGMTVVSGSTTIEVPGTFQGIAMYGFEGADWLRLDDSVSVVSVTFAGADDDQLFDNGSGRSYLYGQDGADLLVTVGGGGDVLYGGEGLDSLWLDAADLTPDVASAETAGKTVHSITAFNLGVSLEIQGQNLTDPATTYSYANYNSRPLFVDTPEFNDVQQGYLGDCYFLAAVGSLAYSDPGDYAAGTAGVIQEMIAPLGDGSYAVRFYNGSTPVYVRVDGDLPVYGSRLIFADLTPDGETWVALAEKAYAQFAGANSYANIEGGYMFVVYNQVTGVTSSWKYTSATSASELESLLGAGRALSAASATDSYPIVGGHAYEILDVYQQDGQTYVTLYNPWGVDGADGYDDYPNDGLIDLTWTDFVAKFSWIAISAV